MENKRFCKIIDLIINYINVSFGICGVLHMLHYTKYISEEEKVYISVILHRKWKDNDRYYYNGEFAHPHDVPSGNYRFPNDEKRIEFLNKLKKEYGK